jgi:hypothetical protein
MNTCLDSKAQYSADGVLYKIPYIHCDHYTMSSAIHVIQITLKPKSNKQPEKNRSLENERYIHQALKGAKHFPLHQNIQTALGPTQTTPQWVTGVQTPLQPL